MSLSHPSTKKKDSSETISLVRRPRLNLSTLSSEYLYFASFKVRSSSSSAQPAQTTSSPTGAARPPQRIGPLQGSCHPIRTLRADRAEATAAHSGPRAGSPTHPGKLNRAATAQLRQPQPPTDSPHAGTDPQASSRTLRAASGAPLPHSGTATLQLSHTQGDNTPQESKDYPIKRDFSNQARPCRAVAIPSCRSRARRAGYVSARSRAAKQPLQRGRSARSQNANSRYDE